MSDSLPFWDQTNQNLTAGLDILFPPGWGEKRIGDCVKIPDFERGTIMRTCNNVPLFVAGNVRVILTETIW